MYHAFSPIESMWLWQTRAVLFTIIPNYHFDSGHRELLHKIRIPLVLVEAYAILTLPRALAIGLRPITQWLSPEAKTNYVFTHSSG